MTALILAGHGSHYRPGTAVPVWHAVDTLRERGAFSVVTAAFWKEQPSFAHVLSGIDDDDVLVVPLFSTAGFFTQEVLPAELRPRAGQRVKITTAVGEHPRLAHIVDERIRTALERHNLSASEVTVVMVGHGTRQVPTSADTTEAQAERLRQRGSYTAVLTGYLDQSPFIEDIYQQVHTDTLVVVPFFIAAGLHTQDDIPAALSIAPEPFIRQQSAGHTVIYAPPVGLTAELPQMILSLTKDHEPSTSSPNQSGIPAVRSGLLVPTRPVVGAVWLGHAAYLCHTADAEVDPTSLTILESMGAVRRMARGENTGEAYRPWATLGGLPRGWRIPTADDSERSAALVTIYPHLTTPPAVQTVRQVAARQVGKYQSVGSLGKREITAVVQRVCTTCLLQPSWHTPATEPALACPEPCIWWLEASTKQAQAKR